MEDQQLKTKKKDTLNDVIEADALITTLYRTASLKDDGFILPHEEVITLLKMASTKIRKIEDYFYD